MLITLRLIYEFLVSILPIHRTALAETQVENWKLEEFEVRLYVIFFRAGLSL